VRDVPKRTRIYTRAGDSGQTGLVGGQRVSKSSLRIECFGAIDECSSAIGLARRALADETDVGAARPQEAGATSREAGTTARGVTSLDAWLAWTQDVLFDLGSDLATPPQARREQTPRIVQRDIDALEAAIDAAEATLPPLNTFILPGGSLAGGFLHLARAMCRRAERHIVRLAETESVEPTVLKYVNRLSDALFVWARWINDARGSAEHRWRQSSPPPDVY